MPHVDRCYWTEQIDLEFSQYCDLSKKERENWLHYKKLKYDSMLKYIEKRRKKY